MRKLLTPTFLCLVCFMCSCGESTKRTEGQEVLEARRPLTPHEKKMQSGKLVYIQFCMSCHMEKGQGITGVYPPLINTGHVTGDKEKLINIVLHGLKEPVEIDGHKYTDQMVGMDYLSDEQIADVLTYVRQSFGNDESTVNEHEVKEVRKKK